MRIHSLLLSIIYITLFCFVITGLFWILQTNAALTQSDSACPDNLYIEQTLAANARWELCWEHHAQAGIILRDIFYTTPSGLRRRVLQQANVAQVHTALDDGSQRAHYLTELGLGGKQLVALEQTDCPDGSLLTYQSINILCIEVIQRGYMYKHDHSQRQGEYLSLYSISDLGGQNLIIRWHFYDDGTIEPMIGSSGYLQHFGTDPRYGWPMDGNGPLATAYVNTYHWRLDFGIGEEGHDEIVEEFNVLPAEQGLKKELSVTQLTEETGRSVDPQNKRSWRIRDSVITNSDGHFVSYHLEPLNVSHRYIGPEDEPWTEHDIYFTVDKECEQFVSQNLQGNDCGENLTEFVTGENIHAADVVLWYNLSRHHLPRREYQPFIPTQWDSFKLLPRDWTANNELAK